MIDTMNTKESFLNAVSHLITLCSIRLSDDVASALQKLADGETDETAKTMYRCIADDLALADRLHRPICQDTGMLQFFLDVGTGFPYMDEIEDVEWEDFGMAEALWVLRVKEFGPLIVSIDTQGNNLFAENQARYESRLKQITA